MLFTKAIFLVVSFSYCASATTIISNTVACQTSSSGSQKIVSSTLVSVSCGSEGSGSVTQADFTFSDNTVTFNGNWTAFAASPMDFVTANFGQAITSLGSFFTTTGAGQGYVVFTDTVSIVNPSHNESAFSAWNINGAPGGGNGCYNFPEYSCDSSKTMTLPFTLGQVFTLSYSGGAASVAEYNPLGEVNVAQGGTVTVTDLLTASFYNPDGTRANLIPLPNATPEPPAPFLLFGGILLLVGFACCQTSWKRHSRRAGV